VGRVALGKSGQASTSWTRFLRAPAYAVALRSQDIAQHGQSGKPGDNRWSRRQPPRRGCPSLHRIYQEIEAWPFDRSDLWKRIAPAQLRRGHRLRVVVGSAPEILVLRGPCSSRQSLIMARWAKGLAGPFPELPGISRDGGPQWRAPPRPKPTSPVEDSTRYRRKLRQVKELS